MKVTSLQVSNLLSFDDFCLDFDDGLTILVGPNGVGKTNIVRILDLVTKLIDQADERSRPGTLSPVDATGAAISSYLHAKHDTSPPGTPMEIRLGVEFTTPSERSRIVAFVQAALLATLSEESSAQGDEDRNAKLEAWITKELDEENLIPLFTGVLAFRHPGYDDGLWEARYEFDVNGSLYDWILYVPNFWASIVVRGAAANRKRSETRLSEALLGFTGYPNPPPPLPDPLPHVTLSNFC